MLSVSRRLFQSLSTPILFASGASPIIGIDLGTTNSCVSIVEGEEPRVIQNSEGQRTTPSVVYINPESGEIIVGEPAKRQSTMNPKDTFFATKRLIGRRFDSAETKKYTDSVPFDVTRADNGDAWVEAGGKKYSPAQIGAHILTKMKKTAESYLDRKVDRAVITVPAYFNDAQRQATKDAGRIAGLKVERIINEPTAAALAFGLDKGTSGKTIAVYDLGGGTFDSSILELTDGVFEVKATDGDTMLGGEDFDNEIVQHLLAEIKKDKGVDLSQDPLAMSRLREAAENAKRELDSSSQVDIQLPYISGDASGPIHFSTKLSLAKFNSLVEPLVQRTLKPLKSCLKSASLDTKAIDEVILIGGMTRTPLVQEAVAKFFGRQPYKGVNPDEAVAQGAAIQGGVLSGTSSSNLLLLDVTPLSLGIETEGGLFFKQIPRNTTIPCSRTETFSTAADYQTQVEVRVAQGEREFFNDNASLGNFVLDGIPPARRGVPKIDVSFEVDADGLVKVTATNQETKKSKNIEIRTDGGLTEAQIRQMVDDAEKYKDDDAERKRLIEKRNEAERICYDTQKSLDENKSKVPESTASSVTEAISKLREVAKGDDVTAIENEIAEFSKVSTEFSRAMQEANADAETPEADAETPEADAETVDAEVVDADSKDSEKK